MKKHRNLLLKIGLPLAFLGVLGVFLLSAGFMILGGGVASYVALEEEELTDEEQYNLDNYGCTCGDCSGGLEFLDDGEFWVSKDGESGELLGGDYSSTHNTDNLTFKTENMSGLNDIQNANAKTAFEFFRNNGFTYEATVGILSNMYIDSTFNVDPWSEDEFKYTYGITDENVENIINYWIPYATDAGYSISTIDGQLYAILYAMESGYRKGCFESEVVKGDTKIGSVEIDGYRITLEEFKALKDAELACEYFALAFEQKFNGDDSELSSSYDYAPYLLNSKKENVKVLLEYFEPGITSTSPNNQNTQQNSNSTNISNNTGKMTIPTRGKLDSSRGAYGIPVWTGYSMDDTEQTVVIPVETDMRVEPKIAQKERLVYAPDTMSISERADSEHFTVSTEFPSKEELYDQQLCETFNGRLGIAVGSALIAWDKDPDNNNSMIGVLLDVVFKDGTVIPCIVKDAKANIHTGDLHMFYAGGKLRAHEISDGIDWKLPDYSFIEIYRAYCEITGTYKGRDGKTRNIYDWTSQKWLTKFGRECGGISHIKVYNHQNVAYALNNNAIQPGQQPTINNNVIPQPGNGTVAGLKSSVELTYGPENVDIDGWTVGTKLPYEYDIECKKITVNQHLLPESSWGKFDGEINSLIVHYALDGGKTGDEIYSHLKEVKLSSNFSIGTNGTIYQFVPLTHAGKANNYNGNRISIEVSNINASPKNYTKESYESLVHLAAWIAVKYNLSTDFKWETNYLNNKTPLNMYRDMGDIHRHYDNEAGSDYGGTAANNYFRGKACPAYWVPNDDSSEDDQHVTDGGNARWIAFKEHVTEFILKYRDDPNFEIEGVSGLENIEVQMKDASNPNWSNGYMYSTGTTGGSLQSGTYVGRLCGCSIPCDSCDCHDEEWELIKQGQDLNNMTNNNLSGGSYNGGVTDGVKLSGLTLKERGMGSVEGEIYKVEDGILTWIGNDWNSTVFLASARSLIVKLNNAGADYGYGVYKDIEGVGNMRLDCSGYVSQVLKQMGYSCTGTETSTHAWSDIGFTQVPNVDDIKPGDILQFTGHTNIFCGWIDQSKGIIAAYDNGSSGDIAKMGPNYYEPRQTSVDKFITAWRPIPIATTVDGKFYDTSINSGVTGSDNSVNAVNKKMHNEPGEILNVTALSNSASFSLNNYFYMADIEVGDDIYNRIIGKSLPETGAEIDLSDIKYVQVLHKNFKGQTQVGELIVHKDLAVGVIKAFKELYYADYQIEKMYLIEHYWDKAAEIAGSTERDSVLKELDVVSMSDNNTSAFCHRRITGGKGWSNHAFGKAIDINPLYNPYVTSSGEVSPPNGKPYANRDSGMYHMILKDDVCYKAFMNNGYNSWGGNYTSPKDYQHFEKK